MSRLYRTLLPARDPYTVITNVVIVQNMIAVRNRRSFKLCCILFSLCLVSTVVFYQLRAYKKLKSFVSVSDFRVAVRHAAKQPPVSRDHLNGVLPCTMSTCFDIARCRNGFKVYVYPSDSSSSKPATSVLYKKIVDVIRDSPFFTADPTQACLLVPNIDALDRDRLSQDYNKQLPAFGTLAHWNGGKNHLLFGQYLGTWPDYAEDIDYDTGQAIIARASFSTWRYRANFDVSIPLLPKDHPEKRGDSTANRKTFPLNRKYVLSFRGKRYVHGVGSDTRNWLHHIHNGKDVIAVTTCRHGSNWEKLQDERCGQDNALYDKYEYQDLLVNSTFCLVPRGRRLGSFRFLEALQAGCIPVSLSNGYVLPFEEVIDWKQATLRIDEQQLLQVPSVVRSMMSASACRVLLMRLQTLFLWDTYFSSVQKVIMTTLKVIQDRIQKQSFVVWNTPPGALTVHSDFSLKLSDFPFYSTTAQLTQARGSRGYSLVIATSLLTAKRTAALIRSLAAAPHLRKIVVLCSEPTVPARTFSQDAVSLPVIIRTVQATYLDLWDLPDVETDAVLSVTNDMELTSDEVEHGYKVWLSFPEHLIGLAASYGHHWNPGKQQWSHNTSNSGYSFVTGAIFYHRYYGYMMKYHHGAPPSANLDVMCSEIALNVLVSGLTHKPPVRAFEKKVTSSSLPAAGVDACLNSMASSLGHLPLYHSSLLTHLLPSV